jgi:UDP-hydrolysing UDP-N-acetyl-D-glucosamine 2-epimerase
VRTVGVVTVARSDYGILRSVLRALDVRDDVELRLYVGGMHLSDRFGRTVEEIERDGFPIAERVDFLLPDDSPAAVAASIGRGVEAFAAVFDRNRPDIIVLLGDRFEMLAAGIAALPVTIPLAHIHGGESTFGLIDESIRHALTKLSHLHFAATHEYGQRIIQLGEEPWRVTVSGAPALDAVRKFEPLSDRELAANGVRLRGATLLVTYHPVTLVPERTTAELDAILQAVAASEFDAVLTYPNADPQNRTIIDRLKDFAAASDRFTLVPNLGQDAYFTLLERVVAMVGNSSSGIIEAASFRLPVVDVGMRQSGRMRAANVIHVESDQSAIAAAIGEAASSVFAESLQSLVNPYGDGEASVRIAERLATVSLDERLIVKRFHDVVF